jgi:hypothetical protein
VALAVRFNPAPGREGAYFYRRVEDSVGLAELEEVASSLRSNLGKRRGFVVVSDPASAEVIVELRGYSTTYHHHLWGALFAARDPRLQLGSSYATHSWPRRSGPHTVGDAVNDFAADVETIVADNLEITGYLRGRPVGDTSPVGPSPSAPLQGEYSLTVAASRSCPAPSAETIPMPSDYYVTLYQRGDAVSLLVRGTGLHGCFDCPDKVRGQVVGDAVSLRGVHAGGLLLASEPFRWVWTGKVTGVVREDRIDAQVVGPVSLYRDGKDTNERIYNCEAADHRWTLTRRK